MISTLLFVGTILYLSYFEIANEDKYIIVNIYAQEEISREIPLSNNSTAISNNTLQSEQKFLQLQNKIQELQNQYNQISNRTSNIETLIDQIMQNYVTTNDLGLSINQLKEDFSNQFTEIYEGNRNVGSIINDLQSIVNELQISVNDIQRFEIFDNCVLAAAQYGAMTDLSGFAETLRSCAGQ